MYLLFFSDLRSGSKGSIFGGLSGGALMAAVSTTNCDFLCLKLGEPKLVRLNVLIGPHYLSLEVGECFRWMQLDGFCNSGF